MIDANICSKCHRDLSNAIKYLGRRDAIIFHRAAHQRTDLRKLIIKYKDKLDPVFYKKLEEIME